MTIEFSVTGVPQPRGSKKAMPNRAGGRPLMVDDNPRSKPWMATVASEAALAMKGRPLFGGPLKLSAVFWFPRPKSHYRTGKNAHIRRDDAPMVHSNKPDCDKLIRAVGDAMTGVVYRDDSQLAALDVQKRYSEHAGSVSISVSELVSQIVED